MTLPVAKYNPIPKKSTKTATSQNGLEHPAAIQLETSHSARPKFRAKPKARNYKKPRTAIFFNPLPATTYAISHQKNPPNFAPNAQVRLNMEGACCSRPERNAAMNTKIHAMRSIASASFNPRIRRPSPARRGVYKCKHLKKRTQFERTP
jgi:hypothetical protein